MRNIKILKSQFEELSLREFFNLLKKSLFTSEPICIYRLNISIKTTNFDTTIEDIDIIKGSVVDIEIAGENLNPLPWEFQCHKYDGVEDFFVAKNHEGVQHISWIYYHNHRNRLLSLGENDAEIKFCLTLPALRGRGIYPRVILSISNYLRSKGIQQVFMCVHRDNHSSIRGIEKAGFIKVGEIRLKKIFGVQISPLFDTSRL